MRGQKHEELEVRTEDRTILGNPVQYGGAIHLSREQIGSDSYVSIGTWTLERVYVRNRCACVHVFASAQERVLQRTEERDRERAREGERMVASERASEAARQRDSEEGMLHHTTERDRDTDADKDKPH